MSSPEVSCTCLPSPPGGTTRCEGGQIAVCGDGGTGTCQGMCVTVDPQLGFMEYAAELLSAVIRANLSASEIRDDAERFANIVDKLLESSAKTKGVNFKFNGRLHHVSIGLTDVAKEKLGKAVQTLANAQRSGYMVRG